MFLAVRPYLNASTAIPGHHIKVKHIVRSIVPFDTAFGVGPFLKISLNARLPRTWAIVLRKAVARARRVAAGSLVA